MSSRALYRQHVGAIRRPPLYNDHPLVVEATLLCTLSVNSAFGRDRNLLDCCVLLLSAAQTGLDLLGTVIANCTEIKHAVCYLMRPPHLRLHRRPVSFHRSRFLFFAVLSISFSPDCCSSEVVSSNCSNGLAGVESSDGTVCCAEACNGQCGGVGCGSIDGTDGATDCCSGTILMSGVSCDDSAESPCIIDNGTSTDAPTASPTGAFTVEPTVTARGGEFSMSPTTLLDQTSAPTVESRNIDFTAGPSVFDPTISPSMIGDSSTTLFPGVTMRPTSDASAASAGIVVMLAAMAGGMFAVFAAARK